MSPIKLPCQKTPLLPCGGGVTLIDPVTHRHTYTWITLHNNPWSHKPQHLHTHTHTGECDFLKLSSRLCFCILLGHGRQGNIQRMINNKKVKFKVVFVYIYTKIIPADLSDISDRLNVRKLCVGVYFC